MNLSCIRWLYLMLSSLYCLSVLIPYSSSTRISPLLYWNVFSGAFLLEYYSSSSLICVRKKGFLLYFSMNYYYSIYSVYSMSLCEKIPFLKKERLLPRKDFDFWLSSSESRVVLVAMSVLDLVKVGSSSWRVREGTRCMERECWMWDWWGCYYFIGII